MNLDSSIENLSKVGKAVAKKLEKVGIRTIGHLLYYFPHRYEDYRGAVTVKDLTPGSSVSVKARVELISNRRSFKSRKMMTEALVSDESGSLRIVWFNQPYIIKNIKVGDEVVFSGSVKSDMLGPELINPTYSKVAKIEPVDGQKLLPVYFLTSGLSQKYLQYLVKEAFFQLKNFPDFLSDKVLDKYDFSALYDALYGMHFPADQQNLEISKRRLKFDELLLVQLKAELSRRARSLLSAPAMDFKEIEVKNFVSSLPFILTNDQKLSAWEILKDLKKSVPMNRLLSGDVGSGKTVVSAIALFNTVLNNYQGAILAPTEILAKQHFDNISKLLNPYGIKVALYTRSQHEINIGGQSDDKKLKKEILSGIKNGSIQVIVGTHAILTDKVDFCKFGLAIVDEQHRFGVEQRKNLKEKGEGVHFLSLTATPIPRSLALTFYGDLDLSTINELPAGRLSIKTRLVEKYNRDKAYQFIRSEVKKGRQAFVVCPLIEDGGDEKKSVLAEYEKLSKKTFPDLRVDFLHGRLKGSEKEEKMNKFRKAKVDILVATSVIEVGIDIPNASVMMIEGAERFGLAQLHQFRGRVGRSVFQSYCLLFTDTVNEQSLDRLKFFEKNNSGFKLAEKDLETRGPGEVYGKAQSGLDQFKLADMGDLEIVKISRQVAKEAADSPEDFRPLFKKLEYFEEKVHLE